MSLQNSQTITCRGAVCWGPGQGLKVEEIQVDPPQKDEVRVRLLRASICHTDILFLGAFPVELFPRIVGHEGVGVVESVGEGVTCPNVGDIVIPTFLGECKECPNCLSNKTNLCLRYPLTLHGLMPDNTSRMSVRGQKLYHAFTCSTLCEFTVVNANYVTKIDMRVPLSHASLLSCGFSTGFGAVWKQANIEKCSTVAVFGLGAVGLGAVSGAKSLGAARIIGVELNNARKNIAEDMGMTEFINPKDIENKTISEAIEEITHGLGVDYSVECTGAVELVSEALASTIPGKVMAVIAGAGHSHTATVGLLDLLSGKTLKGCLFGGVKTQSDLPTIFSKCADEEFHLGGMVTDEIGLSDISSALEILKKPECLKLVVKIAEIDDGVCF